MSMYQKEMVTYHCDGVLRVLKLNHAEHVVYLYMRNLASIRAKTKNYIFWCPKA